MNKKEIIVEKRKKITNLLQDYGFSFVDVNNMLRNKDVRVNGVVTKSNVQLEEGDCVLFFYSDEMLEKKYEVLYEDDEVYVIYKNAGIESDGEKGVERVLKNAIAVHRLDRNTEGVMVYAKNEQSAKKLESGFKNNKIHKFYLAEVVGEFRCKQKGLEAYLLKDAEKSQVKIFQNKVQNSVPIKMNVEPLKVGKESSVLKIELLTGKTHQIRAHLAFLGNPIIGDGKYGRNNDNKKFKESRQKLACFLMKFENIGVKGLDGKLFEKYPRWYNFQK